jgi:hypothetical protein
VALLKDRGEFLGEICREVGEEVHVQPLNPLTIMMVLIVGVTIPSGPWCIFENKEGISNWFLWLLCRTSFDQPLK